MNEPKSEPKTELGKLLENLRIKNNFSKREFAQKHLHCSPDTLTRMIDGGEQPTIKFLRSVSSYTGKSLLALLQMSFPDEIREPTANEMAAAQKIHAMPEPRRSWFLELVDNADIRSAKTERDKGEIRVVKKDKRRGKNGDI